MREIVYVPDNWRRTFWTPYEQYRDKIGQTFTVLGSYKVNEGTEDEVTLYKIRLADGSEIGAWPEEVFEEERGQER